MRLLVGLMMGSVGVLLIVAGPLLAFAGGVWDAMALGIGDVMSGPQLADRFPSGVFLLGVPVGLGLVVAGWRMGRSREQEREPGPTSD